MEKNKIQIKTEFPSEVVSIYSPDNELLVTSDNPLVIESTRYKILKENLSGYYAVDADGKKHEISRHLPTAEADGFEQDLLDRNIRLGG